MENKKGGMTSFLFTKVKIGRTQDHEIAIPDGDLKDIPYKNALGAILNKMIIV